MTKHRIERAEDVYPDIEEHLAKPWAMVVRVEGDPIHGDGEPTPTTGEAMVRLCNYQACAAPEAFEGCQPIYLTIGHPWLDAVRRGRGPGALGAIKLGPEQAVALAKGLCTAAERSMTAPETEPPGVPCSTCNVTQAQIDCAIGRSRSEFDYHDPNCERRTFHEREPA